MRPTSQFAAPATGPSPCSCTPITLSAIPMSAPATIVNVTTLNQRRRRMLRWIDRCSSTTVMSTSGYTALSTAHVASVMCASLAPAIASRGVRRRRAAISGR